MKRYLISSLCLVLANIALADPIDKASALSVAQRLLGKAASTVEMPASSAATRAASQSSPAFHIFNATDGQGFVIVSGESQLPEIVAYSDDDTFNADNMHPALEVMLTNYAEIVEEVRNGEYDARLLERKAVTRANAVVPRLCKSKWGQGAPYNTLCPKKDGKECPVGCVATAMAQIMYHFQWPKVGTGKYTYASGISGVGTLSSNFAEHQYAWGDMCESTDDNLANEASASAVAQLSYDCGVASRMQYDPAGSGTHDDRAMKALYTHFGYKASTLNQQHRACYATQEEWDALVCSYLDKGQPVLYGGYTKRGEGHEFIIDGYDEEGLFHVNWGWDGSSNGFYSIVTLLPKNTSTAFSQSQSMVCGFEPDEEGTDKTPQQWRIYMVEPPTVTDEKVELGTSFYFHDHLFYNYSNTAYTWTIGVALYDRAGNFVKLVSSTKMSSGNTQQILSYYGYTDKNIKVTIPADIADGSYTLRSVFRQEGYDDFVLPQMVGGTHLNNVPLLIENGVAYFDEATSIQDDNIPYSAPAVSEKANAATYNLAGQRVGDDAKGIVVRNGKKILR